MGVTSSVRASTWLIRPFRCPGAFTIRGTGVSSSTLDALTLRRVSTPTWKAIPWSAVTTIRVWSYIPWAFSRRISRPTSRSTNWSWSR